MIKQKNTICSLVFNAAIILFCIIGLLVPFITHQGVTNMLLRIRYYDFDINILLAISSIIYVVGDILILVKKINSIPKWMQICKLATTSCVCALFAWILILSIFSTFAGTIFDAAMNFSGAQLYFQLIIPTIAIISFLFFEKSTINIELLNTLFALIPIVLYSIFYISFCYAHKNADIIPDEYDVYGLFSWFNGCVWIFLIMANGFTYIFSWLLWLGNKKLNTKSLR